MTDTQKDELNKELQEVFENESFTGVDQLVNLDSVCNWIQTKIEEAESENRKKTIKIVADYIYRNWYSSIGYLNDMQIYKNAFEELDWIIKPLAITMEEIVEAVNANKYNLTDK